MFGNILNTISNAASSVGKTVGNLASSFWNTFTKPTIPTGPNANLIDQGLASLSDVSKVVNPVNLAGDALNLFGRSIGLSNEQSSRPENMSKNTIPAWDSSGNVTEITPTPEQQNTYASMQKYAAPSVPIGGMSFVPAGPSAPLFPSPTPTPSGGGGGGNYGTPPPGYVWGSNGQAVVAPQAPSGGKGSGTPIAGGGAGNTPAPQGQSGSAGGGTSASLGAGSAVQGASVTGAPSSGDSQQKDKNTQKVSQPAAFIPYTGYGSDQELQGMGLSRTVTPGGGTGFTDKQGNFYVQDAGGFHLKTELPAGSTPMGGIQSAPQIMFAQGGGNVYMKQNQDGSIQYYVNQGRGFQPVINPNLNGQTNGQLTGQLGAPDTNVGFSAQGDNKMVQVGPATQPQGAGGASAVDANAPQFNAGGTGNPIDVGNLVGGASQDVQSIADAISSGNYTPTSLSDFNNRLQTLVSQLTSAMTTQSGIDPSTNYNIDPSLIANGDQNISHAIANDPTGFNQLNEQFGVPQLQQKYLTQISTIGGINSAVARLTQEILSDNNMPKGLAQNQISYLAAKANELMTPFQAQADMVKAQLSYATQNMRTYYSNYWNSQRLSLSTSRLGMQQLSLALNNSALGNDPTAIQAWADATGIPADQIALMSNFKNASNAANLATKESTAQANQIMTGLLTNPNTIPSLLSGVQQGIITPDEINGMARTAAGAALKGLFLTSAAESGVNLAGAQASYGFAANKSVKQQIGSLDNAISLTDEMNKLSDAAPRSIPLLNQWAIPGGILIGNTSYSNWSTAVTAYADELSGGLGFGTATDMTRQLGLNLSDWKKSPEQFKSDMQNVIVPFLNNKKNALVGQMGQYGNTQSNTGGTPAPAPQGSAPANSQGADAWANLGL